MSNDRLLMLLLENGGAIGMAVVIVVVLGGFFLKFKGWSGFGDREKLVSKDELGRISSKLSTIDGRVSDIEHDLRARPSRSELHGLEISMTKLGGRIATVEMTTKATAAGVTRIEDFLLAIDERQQKRGK